MNEIQIRSKWKEQENEVAKILKEKGIKYKQNPVIEGCNYRPDFIAENLDGSKYIIEVRNQILNMSKIIAQLVDAHKKLSKEDIDFKMLLIVFEKVSPIFENKCREEEIELWDIEKITKIKKEYLLKKKSDKPKTKK